MASISYIKKVWPHEDKITLISLARNYDVLWNTAYPFYRELTQRKKALEEIKELLENKYCVEDINSQWRNLKDVFYKKKSLTEKRAKSGETAKEPAWRYFEPLKYLLECEEERKNIMRKRSQCNIQLQQLEEMRRKRKQQLMMERTWQTQMKTHSTHQFDNLEDFDNVYGDYIKELEQNSELKSSASKSCNLDLNLDHFARTSINLDSPELMSSFHDSRMDKEIKKEMDDVDISLDDSAANVRRINDGEQDSDFTEYSVRNSMERTYSDDRELCHRYNEDHNIDEKNGPTSIGSTTDALLAVVNAASSSHTDAQIEQSPPISHRRCENSYNRTFPPTSLRNKRSTQTAASESTLNTSQRLHPYHASTNFRNPLSTNIVRGSRSVICEDSQTKSIRSNHHRKAGNSPLSKTSHSAHAITPANSNTSDSFVSTSEELDVNKFKFFGNYVESALLDLHQQSPSLARQLVQSIYQTVAEHQAQLIE